MELLLEGMRADRAQLRTEFEREKALGYYDFIFK